jgi:phosphopantetheinyl transferase
VNRIVVQSYKEILTGISAERISHILSCDDIQKASRFYHKEDKDRFTAARILLWHELEGGHTFSDTNLELPLRLTYNAFGKPMLPDCPITFNWSHSGNLVALAVGTTPCGIDIELHHTRPLFDIKSLCTPLELDWLAMLTEQGEYDEKQAFLILWSAKEAALKALGIGLSVDPRHVEIAFVHDEPHDWETTIHCTELKGHYRTIECNSESYALAWCTTERLDAMVYDNRISNVCKW